MLFYNFYLEAHNNFIIFSLERQRDFWQPLQQVRQWGLTYIHTCRPMSTRRAIFHERRISSVTFVVSVLLGNYFAVAGRFVRFWASGGAKFPKMGDSLPITPVNHRVKFDAASFIIAKEIRNRTNKKQTNKQ